MFSCFEERRPLFCVARQAVVDDMTAHDVGHMNIECPFCRALHWMDERVSHTSAPNHIEFGMCCEHGKLKLPALQVPPSPLLRLFVENSPSGKEFRQNIVQYNAALAFTSMGVDIDRSILSGGPPVFRIHGELTHLSGSLLPEDGAQPSYAQLYIYDPKEAYQCRILRNDNLSLNTMKTLQQLIEDSNRYHPLYQHAYEILQQYHSPDFGIKLAVL